MLELSYDSAISFSGVYQRAESICFFFWKQVHKNLCMKAHSSINSQRRKPPKCQMITGFKKMWCICTMQCYSAVRNRILTHATPWMNLENMMLSERCQTEKATYCAIPYTWSAKMRRIHRTTSSCWLPRGGGMGKLGVTANRNGASFGVMECSAG